MLMRNTSASMLILLMMCCFGTGVLSFYSKSYRSVRLQSNSRLFCSDTSANAPKIVNKEYKIIQFYCKNESIGDTFIGLTTDLPKYLRQYARYCNDNDNKYNNSNYPLFQFMRDNSGWNNWNHRILETFESTTISKARQRKKDWIESINPSLNVVIRPVITDEESKDWFRQYNKQYNLDNKEKVNEKLRQYYLKNKEKILERLRKYRLENLERIQEKDRQLKFLNRDKINKRSKQKYLEKKKEINEQQLLKDQGDII